MPRLDVLTLVVFVGIVLSMSAHGRGEDLGIIYPEVREPFASIFNSMLEGIYEVHGDDAHSVAIKKEYNPQDIVDWVDDNEISRIIALGSRSQKLVENIKLPIDEVVLGAVTKPPENRIFKAGIMLAPAPERVYEQLEVLLPDLEKIYIVHSKGSRWYVKIAQKAATDKDFSLEAIETESLAESAKQYKAIMDRIDSQSAVWLLQDSLSADSRLLLPMILEAAWNKRFPVISNSAGHVRRGVLLALYPEPFEFGVDLAHTTANGNDEVSGFAPFNEALRAANTRTAEHLGLNWPRSTIRDFDLVFPSE